MSRSDDIRRIVLGTLAAMLLAFSLQGQVTPPPTVQPPPGSNLQLDTRPVGTAPSNVSAAASGPFGAAVTWTVAPWASGTIVSISTDTSRSSFRQVYKDSVPGPALARLTAPRTPRLAQPSPTLQTAPTYGTNGLLPATTYYFKVAAWYADSAPGAVQTGAATGGPPPPTNLKAAAFPAAIMLSWDPAPNAAKYRVNKDGVRIAEILPAQYADGMRLKTEYSDAAVPGGSYRYQIDAVYVQGGLPERVGSASISVNAPNPPPPPIRGFADTHTHQFANRGFGGLMFWGNAYGPIEEASPWCTPAHGPGGLNDIIGNAARGTLGHLVGGSPQFDGWPKWNTLTHQQMHSDWLYRALQGGLKLMVMHAVNNEMLCGLAAKADGRSCDDMEAVDLQLQAAKDMEQYTDNQFGGAGKGWYRLVYSPQQARDAIAKGQLAVVLGIEVDNIFGCRSAACDESTVDKELQRYYEIGVRHFHPIHFANNAFGGFALFNALFNVNNRFLTGAFAEVADVGECKASGFEFRFPLAGSKDALLSVNSTLANFMAEPGWASYPGGAHCNKQGLTPLGEYLITQMMNRGMIIDIDHMSKRAIDATLNLTSARGYPVIAGHTGLVGTSIGDKKSEAQKTDDQVTSIAAKGGLVSLILHQGTTDEIAPFGNKVANDCGLSSKSWAQSYLYAVARMGGPTKAAVGLATDQGLNEMVAPRFGPEECGGKAVVVQSKPVVYPITPLVSGPALGKSVSGKRTFDYNVDGLAHVGMLPDFIQDLRNVGVDSTDLEPLFRSAEAYIAMWERAVASTPRP